MNDSIKDRVLANMARASWLSAYQHARLIDADAASVSSILRRLAKSGEVVREKGRGPNGGYGYALPFRSRRPAKSRRRPGEPRRATVERAPELP